VVLPHGGKTILSLHNTCFISGTVTCFHDLPMENQSSGSGQAANFSCFPVSTCNDKGQSYALPPTSVNGRHDCGVHLPYVTVIKFSNMSFQI
jgi:hypothetical protein